MSRHTRVGEGVEEMTPNVIKGEGYLKIQAYVSHII
jgi:hypothetical protein